MSTCKAKRPRIAIDVLVTEEKQEESEGTTNEGDDEAQSTISGGTPSHADPPSNTKKKRPRMIIPEELCRRSNRDLKKAELQKKDVKLLLTKIRRQHRSTVVLKVKEHLNYDISSAVLNAILEALYSNHKCQALYLQNLNLAMRDEQVDKLAQLLSIRTNIWCLNLGENYEVTAACWNRFCDALANTHVSHIYLSEHTITVDLKTRIRAVIRENRKKHDLHSSESNYDVIARCTNMWWNPINGLRNKRIKEELATRKHYIYRHVYSTHTVDTKGKAHEVVTTEWDGDWRFHCICGKECSSNNPWRDHPTGRMFECTQCKAWAHTDCELGEDVTDEEVPEDVICHRCHAINDRRTRSLQRLGWMETTTSNESSCASEDIP